MWRERCGLQGNALDQCLQRVDEVMGKLIRLLHVKLARHIPPVMTHSQFIICRTLLFKRSVTVSELAELLGVSLSAVTASADKLCELGFVVRRRDDRDRRLVRLELTPAGEAVITGGLEAWEAALRKYFAQLPLEDVAKLAEVLEKLYEVMRAEDEEEEEKEPGTGAEE